MDNKILIIDDHDEIRTALAYLLENANKNYTVFTGRTADEGLELLKENPDIQVIILDIIMPVKNGNQVLLELKDKLENLRIIVLTGYPGNFTADVAKKLGVFRYLPKPPGEEPLIFAIESAFSDIEIKNLKKELELTEQWKELGILSTDFVHWVGNKVSLIPNYLDLVQEEVQTISEASSGKCQKINEIIQEIIEMRDTLLEPFKETKPETVSINRILDQSLALLKKTDVKIERHYKPKDIKTIFNRVELKKIFDELFNNAVNAMENSTRKQLEITTQEEVDNRVIIKIKDTGYGIKKEDKDKIFRPFYSDRRSKGYGVGLFMVKNTLAKFGGTIEFTSKYGSGTEFTIRLKKEEKK